MNITLLIIAVIFFAVGYIAKRRFGLLGLALIAGSIVSANWSDYVAFTLQFQGVKLLSPPLNVVTAVALLVLPAFFLLFVGPKYHKKWQKIAGSVLFSMLGTLLVATAIAREAAPSLIMPDSQSWAAIAQAYPLIIAAGVALAVGDTVMAHLPKKGKKSTD